MDQLLDYQLTRARAEYIAALASPEVGLRNMLRQWRAGRQFDKIAAQMH